jgi:RNA polymerase sigma factor (sigma-70 family)
MGLIPDDDIAAQKKKVDAHLRTLAADRGEMILTEVRSILFSNLDRGRIKKFTEQNSIDLQAYVLRVVQLYEKLREYLRSIQVDKADTEWIALKARLDHWAYSYLRKKGFRSTQETIKLSKDYASDAAITILNAYFPYDTEFEPWAFVLLQNVCRQKISKATRKSKIPDHLISELDDDLWRLADPGSVDIEGQTGMRQLIQDAIEKLSTRQKKQIIQLRYFKGFSFKEIADQLDKSINAVYKSHFDAMNDLHEILIEDLGLDDQTLA